jgi:hypothetical protein
MTMKTVVPAAMLLMLFARASSAQVSLRGSSAPELVNRLPVDVLAMVQRGTGASADFEIVRVRGRSVLPVRANGQLVAIEPVDVRVVRREMFKACAAEAPSGQATQLADLVRELDQLESLDSAAAQEKIAAASALAMLDLDQKLDERATRRNDPLRAELKRQQEEYAASKTPVQRFQDALKDQQESLGNALSDVADVALAWSAADQVKLDILRDEVRNLRPIIEQARMAYRIKQIDVQAQTAEAKAWQAYHGRVHDALLATAGGSNVAAQIRAARKVCAGPSGTWDWIELTGSAPQGSSVVFAQIRFDRGGRYAAVFRRMAGGDRWAGRLIWPPEASSAEIRIASGDLGRDATFSVATARPPMTTRLRDAEKSVKQIEHRLKVTNFRAAGADNIKTVAIP